MFQNNVKKLMLHYHIIKTVVGDNDFKIFKIIKTIINYYGFKLKVKTMVGDNSFNHFKKILKP